MQEQGIAILSEAIKACTEEIESHKGKLTVKDAPRAVRITRYCQSFSDSLSLSLSLIGIWWVWYCYCQVSEREDKLLADAMAKMAHENEEVSGDEGSEEEEDTGMGDVDLENSGIRLTEWILFLSVIVVPFDILFHQFCLISIILHLSLVMDKHCWWFYPCNLSFSIFKPWRSSG